MKRCTYHHNHYEDGSSVIRSEKVTDTVEAQEELLLLCLHRKLFDKVSTVPPAQRCLFQGCETVFAQSSCVGAKLFTCHYRHVHYSDGSGVASLESTGTNLFDTNAAAFKACTVHLINGKVTELPIYEASKLLECRVSG